ncbi:NAD(P)/FAD-dependent oxidoreductase [uncultured Gimesia sp.]|mgnify:CR=1 FL=1|uniref:NAD(P)/FAD-dependent oxidoreductase n=1 Tax=uncultured Gimesia sp. TaxID=1678688 RepID=UPI0026388A1A|nr:NAD(P)/FAD-dependent oxidoreductase [uncultured Gimesia sp.]
MNQTNLNEQATLDSEYDVIVIGAGPAGSTVAALLAEQGRKVLVVDRARFPRFHVGESLIPETYWQLKRLGLIDQLKQTAFPKKFSVQFVTEEGTETMPFYFNKYKEHESSQTWQVLRAEFDQMLVNNARNQGAIIQTGAQVLELLNEGEQVTGVKLKLSSKETLDIHAKLVVDASGQSGFIANRLNLKVADPVLKKGTVWAHFKNAQRDSGIDEGATLILQTEGKRSWFWYIPLPDNVVSIGCTGDMEYMFSKERGNSEEIFYAEVERCLGIKRRLTEAQPVTEFMTTKDFSYHTTQPVGPGWMLAGDALGFIDPVYSSGVFLALKSGELIADAINDAFDTQDFSVNNLSQWYPGYRNGLENFRKLVYAFYAPGFSFGTFLRQYPQFKTNLVDILIGDVFKPDVAEMFTIMQQELPELATPDETELAM